MTSSDIDVVMDYRLKEMLATATTLGTDAVNGLLGGVGVSLPPDLVAQMVVTVVEAVSDALGLSTGNVHIEADKVVVRVHRE